MRDSAKHCLPTAAGIHRWPAVAASELVTSGHITPLFLSPSVWMSNNLLNFGLRVNYRHWKLQSEDCWSAIQSYSILRGKSGRKSNGLPHPAGTKFIHYRINKISKACRVPR
jgi:hypothetical protein